MEVNLDDATLARLATEAGLCIAQCWDIDLHLSAEGRQDNAEWVRSAPSVSERRLRQDVADYSNHRAQNALSELRRFAELLNDAKTGVSLTDQPPTYNHNLVSRLVDALHARVHYPGHDGHRAFQDDNQLLIEARAYLNSMKDNEHSN